MPYQFQELLSLLVVCSDRSIESMRTESNSFDLPILLSLHLRPYQWCLTFAQYAPTNPFPGHPLTLLDFHLALVELNRWKWVSTAYIIMSLGSQIRGVVIQPTLEPCRWKVVGHLSRIKYWIRLSKGGNGAGKRNGIGIEECREGFSKYMDGSRSSHGEIAMFNKGVWRCRMSVCFASQVFRTTPIAGPRETLETMN